uniref:Uncharacterized protein n=1 Tax=Kalanchoe fedtschenkoi TaxID=63787 RepID=A0A7N0SVJ0_KALFE
MAFLLNKTNFLSQLRTQSQKSEAVPCRGFHTELGAREKALLAEDPVLKRFKSHKKDAKRIKKVGDILTIAVVAGCCYEIYVRATN